MLSSRYTNAHYDINSAVAKVKNRAEKMQLSKQLNRIDQQHHEEMAEINTKQKKLAKRYGKLRSSTPSMMNEEPPSEVVMYETHTPGFCYRCNGEQKIQSILTSIVTDDVGYTCLHNLVFTNDVLDIEKLLVLHLISVHKSETLAPVRNFKLATMYKDTSPTTRLLEKSRRIGFIANRTMMDLLPFYTIEIKEDPPPPPSIGDRPISPSEVLANSTHKMAHRILFNENLRKLISTVVAALHSSNFPKFRQLIQLAHDPNAIRDTTLTKPHILDFMEFLTEQPIVNSCENFVLTPPFKLKTRDLNIRTLTETLENLIKNLRGSVLQLPKRVNRIKDESQGDSDYITSTTDRFYKRKYSAEMSSSDNARLPRPSMSSNIFKVFAEDEERTPRERRTSSRNSQVPNFVFRNIKAAWKTKKIEYDVEDDYICTYTPPTNSEYKKSSISSTGSRSRRMSSSVSKNLPSSPKHGDAIPEENQDPLDDDDDDTEMNNVFNNVSTSPRVSIISTRQEVVTEPRESTAITRTSEALQNRYHHVHKQHDSFGTGYGKYHIKMTTCKACMEKWKQPLPTPKTPRVKKSSVLPELESQPFKTDSKHRINMLINKELYTLESYDRKFSSNSTTTNKALSKREQQPTDSYDNINISPMYLARIEQEIREKETQKKLEKFLNEPI